jgi:pilus assembly protein CpaB
VNKFRAILTILAALVLASLAVVVAGRYVGNKTRLNTHRVVVARANIELGTPMSADLVTQIDWPRDTALEGTFASISPLLEEPSTKAPRVARTSIMKGEPILESRLAPVGSLGGLSAVIQAGYRAITVRVNDVVGVGGFVLPGSYVDVLVNTTHSSVSTNMTEESISKIVLHHILVLAAAEEIAREESKPKVVNAVTLEVTPEQAERLDLARSVGTLSLVLRNPIDLGESASIGVDKHMLLGTAPHEQPIVSANPTDGSLTPLPMLPPGPEPQPARPPTRRVEIIRGTNRSNESF